MRTRQGREPADECSGAPWTPTPARDPSPPAVRASLDGTVAAVPVATTVGIRLAQLERRRGDPHDLQPRGARRRRARSTSCRARLEDQRAWLLARSGAFSAVVRRRRRRDVVGFGSLSPYKERAAYSTTVEDSVYVDRARGGEGIGTALLTHLVELARTSGFHAVMARIEASGTASRALHARCGFELVGIEREVGRKFNRWLDVAVMQLLSDSTRVRRVASAPGRTLGHRRRPRHGSLEVVGRPGTRAGWRRRCGRRRGR